MTRGDTSTPLVLFKDFMEAKIVSVANGEIEIDLDEEMADALSNLALETLGSSSTEDEREVFIKQTLIDAIKLTIDIEKKLLIDEDKTN
jgi:hypothetical protein